MFNCNLLRSHHTWIISSSSHYLQLHFSSRPTFADIRANEGRLLVRKPICNCSSPVSLNMVFQEMMLNVMMRMIAGKRYFTVDTPEEGKVFKDIMKETFLLGGASNLGDYLPVLSWLGVNGLEKKLIALHEKRNVFFLGLIEQIRKVKGGEVENKKKKTMIGVLLSLQETDPNYYGNGLINIKSFYRHEFVQD